MATATSKNLLTDYLFDKVGFNPTPEQQVILNSGTRFNLVAGGEQAGKSYIASKYLLSKVWGDGGAGFVLACGC